MVNAGDDWGAWIDFPSKDGYPFYFRFYGGLGSAEYTRVWVCTNGFITFDNSNSTSHIPHNIPYPTMPNALVAGIWADLSIDSSASIITGQWEIFSRYYFVIIWKNALHKASGKRLTFQIILEDAPQYYPADRRYGQSRIWISYKNVDAINTDFTYGIEDQRGTKGWGGLCSGDSLAYFNGSTLNFYRHTSSYFLKRLTITFEDDNPDTEFGVVEENASCPRGLNIQRDWGKPSEPDLTYMFATALAGTATLLISVFSPVGWVAAAGIMVDTVLVGLDWGSIYLAYCQYSGRQVDVFDRDDVLEQQANVTALTYDYVVDASLSLVVEWILKTPNDVGTHSLTMTAKLEYYEYTITGEIIEKDPITTMVDLKIGPDDNISFDSADEISRGTHSRLYLGAYDTDDYYKIHVNEGDVIWVYAVGTSFPKPDFCLDLYYPNRTWKAGSPHGYSHTISFAADSTGYWFIRTHIYANYGFYALSVSVYPPGGGGGGCPYVYTWEGSQYVVDNNLLPASETSNGTDVEDYYKLEQTLMPLHDGNQFSLHSLLIKEFEHEHSYFDHVQLLAVDHSSDVNVAVTPNGQILTYKDPAPPMSAVNSLGENALTPLFLTDGNYYEGFKGDYLVLNFGNVISENAKLVMRTDMPPYKMSIHVQVQDSAGDWVDVAAITPRAYWATDIIDLSSYLPSSSNEFKVRLYFTASHKIDYVGLDVSPQEATDVEKGTLILARHSDNGCVTALLRRSDDRYAELLPGQSIKLFFLLPKQTAESRTYIIMVEGHYRTITT